MSFAVALCFAAQLASPPAPEPATTTPTVPAATAPAERSEPPWTLGATGASQLVVVLAPAWGATKGTLLRFVRRGDAWQPDGTPHEVSLGRAGLGWGLGLHPPVPGEPRTIEGDDRSPAGVFALTSSFGRPDAAPEGARLPYFAARAEVCVDDPSSPLYNRIVDKVAADGARSYEALSQKDDRYDLAVVVDHNAARDDRVKAAVDAKKAIRGRGACAFLHVWRRQGSPTRGGTAMDHGELLDLLRWLDPAQRPVLVQLPKPLYRSLQSAWALPAVP